MSIFKIFQRRGFWAVLFILFLTYPKDQAIAVSWNDVLNSLDSCSSSNPSCRCWVEEVLTPARVYRVWQRCSGDVIYSSSINLLDGLATQYSGTGVAWSCDGVINPDSLVYNLDFIYRQYARKETANMTCRGSQSTSIISELSGYIGDKNPCFYSFTQNVNCRSYDVLYAEFSSLVNSCVPSGVCTVNPVTGYMSCNCSCIHEGYNLSSYTDSNNNNIVDLNDGCGFIPVVGEPVNPASSGTSGSTGGSFNTGCVGCNGPDTDADGIPDATDTDCSGPGCTVTSPPTTSTNPDGTTTTTTTSTTHSGGGITPTITTTTSTSGTGSTTPGSTTTTTSTPTGTSTTGCIDVNGDGLDDGSGIECSPAGRQFSAPSASYDPTLETLPEDNIPSRLTGWLSQNPYVSVVQGTRVEVSALQCSLSFTLFNKPMAISFCDLQSYVSLFGAVFVAVCGIRSVMIALGGE